MNSLFNKPSRWLLSPVCKYSLSLTVDLSIKGSCLKVWHFIPIELLYRVAKKQCQHKHCVGCATTQGEKMDRGINFNMLYIHSIDYRVAKKTIHAFFFKWPTMITTKENGNNIITQWTLINFGDPIHFGMSALYLCNVLIDIYLMLLQYGKISVV